MILTIHMHHSPILKHKILNRCVLLDAAKCSNYDNDKFDLDHLSSSSAAFTPPHCNTYVKKTHRQHVQDRRNRCKMSPTIRNLSCLAPTLRYSARISVSKQIGSPRRVRVRHLTLHIKIPMPPGIKDPFSRFLAATTRPSCIKTSRGPHKLKRHFSQITIFICESLY